MTRTHLKAFLIALAAHAAILLFGGLLFFHGPKSAGVREDVELISSAVTDEEQEKKKDQEEKEKAEAEQTEEEQPDDQLAEQKEPMPVLQDLGSLESQVEGPVLAALSLSELEGALNPGMGGDGGFAAGGASSLASGGLIGASGSSAGADLDPVLSLGDLDRRPRAIAQSPPVYPLELRKRKIEGTVQVVFLVDSDGRVQDPKVESSTNPAFEGPALDAVRRWRFETGTRNGEKVQFKLRVPISFRAI